MKLHALAAIALTFDGEASEFFTESILPLCRGITVAVGLSDNTMVDPLQVVRFEDNKIVCDRMDERVFQPVERLTFPLWSATEPYVESVHVY